MPCPTQHSPAPHRNPDENAVLFRHVSRSVAKKRVTDHPIRAPDMIPVTQNGDISGNAAGRPVSATVSNATIRPSPRPRQRTVHRRSSTDRVALDCRSPRTPPDHCASAAQPRPTDRCSRAIYTTQTRSQRRVAAPPRRQYVLLPTWIESANNHRASRLGSPNGEGADYRARAGCRRGGRTAGSRPDPRGRQGTTLRDRPPIRGRTGRSDYSSRWRGAKDLERLPAGPPKPAGCQMGGRLTRGRPTAQNHLWPSGAV